MIKIKELGNPNNFRELHVMSLGTLQRLVDFLIKTCELNKIDPNDVAVTVKDGIAQDDYILSTASLTIGSQPVIASLQFFGEDRNRIDYYTGEDKRSEGGGEFWKSRGPSSFDVSGFVVSKEAGERLLEMTKRVLGKEDCKTWLDWRKYEPNWIQFKFSAKEFDVERIDFLTKGGIITEDILKECRL